MKQKIGLILLVVCAYGGVAAIQILRSLNIETEEMLARGQHVQFLMLFVVPAIAGAAGAIGTYVGITKLWQFQARKSVRAIGFGLVVLFSTPSLMTIASASVHAFQLYDAIDGLAKQGNHYETILTRLINQSQTASDPKVRALAAKKVFELYAVQGTWFDENNQLQVYLPAPEELEKVKAIKAKSDKDFAELDRTKLKRSSDVLILVLFGALVGYVGSLFLLMLWRVVRH